MKDLIPIPKEEDFVKQFENDERLAEEEADGIHGDSSSKLTDEEGQNELGIILKEKEWFKNKNEQ